MGGDSMIYYRVAEEKDLDELSTLLVEGFKNYCFFKETIGKEFKQNEKYEEFLYSLFKVLIKANLKKHLCIVGVIEEKLVSWASLKNPHVSELKIFDYIAVGGLSLFKYISPISILKFLKFTENSHSMCNKLRPSAWYLDSFVVSPNYQGKGVGSKMINDCIKPYIINKGGLMISLVTSSEINYQFYIKNGFQEIEESIITYKNSNLRNWSFCMNLVE